MPGPSTNETDFETLEVTVADHVATVVLNRPEAGNAFTAVMQSELRDLWIAMRSDDDVRVVVLTGSGDRAFCTGIDRNEPFTALDDSPALYGTSNNFMYDDPGDWLGPKANDLWKPVIGAVNGMACGGAFYLLGECDVLIAAEHATSVCKNPATCYQSAASWPNRVCSELFDGRGSSHIASRGSQAPPGSAGGCAATAGGI